MRRAVKAALALPLAAAGAAAGTVAFGVMDYLYDPEFFRPGRKPEPSRETAPGEAWLEPSMVRAGEGKKTVTLRFRCGPGGISEDGGIKVSFCRLVDFGEKGLRPTFLYADGWGPRQNRHPRLPNYYSCELKTSGNARLEMVPQGYFPLRGAVRFLGREFLRRCGVKLDRLDVFYLYLELRKIRIRVRDGRLAEGDEIVIVLGDRRHGSPGWASPAHPSRVDVAVEVDERATGIYRLIAACPVLEAVGGRAVALEPVLSACDEAGEARLLIRAVDEKGEVDPTFTGEAQIVPVEGMEAPYRVSFRPQDRGVAAVTCRMTRPGVYRVGALAGGLAGESNPVPVGGDLRLYWGDLHVHTALCDGCLEPGAFYREARDELGLDFAAITTHDTMDLFEPSGREEEWELVKRLCREYNQPGRFVTFLGYEWSDHRWGHRGIYYAPEETDPPLFSWVDGESDTPARLEGLLRERDAIVVPHHTAWRRIFMALFNWLKFLRMKVPEAYTWWGPENEQQRLVEIYSMHGSSERYDGPFPITHGAPRGWFPRFLRDDRSRPGFGNYVQEALASGLRLGIIAGSDRHDYAVDERYHPIDIYPRGLTAIWADELTPESLWRALWNRRVYGTTGARMVLELFADGLPMGTEYFCSGSPRLQGRVLGTSRLRSVELLRHDERGYSVAWSGAGAAEVGFDLVDGDLRGEGFYYLRAEQEDGHCAWSSPIWICR
ncbi:MAG: CehA/McbA family metallohydrolase [Actinobacteria bacterium]|nr:CehA/McbA family metallohydrolase [Actinomycetota bacterium]